MNTRWCAWCGDDLDKSNRKLRLSKKKTASFFCNSRCERDFWHDVYRSGDDVDTVAKSFLVIGAQV